MEMGQQDGMNKRHLLPQQRQTQFRRGVDQDTALRNIEEYAAAITMVARVGGGAHLAIATQDWNTG
jgi:hypothetical protein